MPSLLEVINESLRRKPLGEGASAHVYAFSDPCLHNYVIRVDQEKEQAFKSRLNETTALTPVFHLRKSKESNLPVRVGQALFDVVDNCDMPAGVTINDFQPGLSLSQYMEQNGGNCWETIEKYVHDLADIPVSHYADALSNLRVINAYSHALDLEGDNILLDKSKKSIRFVDIHFKGAFSGYSSSNNPESVLVHLIGDFFPERRSMQFKSDCRKVVNRMIQAAEQIGYPFEYPDKINSILEHGCQYNDHEKKQIYERIAAIHVNPDHYKLAMDMAENTKCALIPLHTISSKLKERLNELSDSSHGAGTPYLH